MNAHHIAQAVAAGKHHWSPEELRMTDGLIEAFRSASAAGLIDGLSINEPGQAPQSYRVPAGGVYVAGLTSLGEKTAGDGPGSDDPGAFG